MINVAAAIDRALAELATVSDQKQQTLSGQLDMEFLEYVRFQELKSLAFAQGDLTLEDANLVYYHLGNTVDHFNSQPVHVKLVLTMLFARLLKKQMEMVL
jgi:hypothetical protein